MSDSSNSTCVSCRFPGKSGFVFEQTRGTEQRIHVPIFTSVVKLNGEDYGAPFVSKLFVDVIFNVMQHVL